MANYGRRFGGWFLFLSMLLCSGLAAQEPIPAEVAQYGYADLIVFNGKIVSMDDRGYNNNPGSVYEAMAIKGDRIIALGTRERLQGLADSHTKQMDLRGQTVIPGIVDTHAHLFGNEVIAREVGLQEQNVGARLTIKAGKDFESTRLKIETGIQDAVKKLPPEKWILVGVTDNIEEGTPGERVRSWLTSDVIESKDRLDRISPNNPVLVQNGPRANLNSKGFDIGEKLVPHFKEFIRLSIGNDYIDEVDKGFVGVSAQQTIEWDVLYRNQPLILIAELFRRDLQRAAAHGFTTFSSRVPHPRIWDGYTFLNRAKLLPVRFAALYEVHRRPADPQMTRQFYRMTGNMMGLGDDYLWVHGVASELWDSNYPQACLGKDLEAPAKIKAREMCPKPGDLWYDTLQNAMEAGWRLAGIHGVGSDGVRRFTQLIERVMQNTGMTVEDVRKMRPTTEHAQVIGTPPDLIAALKKYNVFVSTGAHRMYDNPSWRQDYGPAADKFAVPAKSLLDQGVRVVGQSNGYRNLGWKFWMFMTRKVDDRVVGPDEALDRVTVLKMWTTWSSEYVMKEQSVGTLEVGKLADFVILDKDYFTIPVDEILKIRPQMTVMGGKIQYLSSELATKLGMEPVGYQFPAGYYPWDKPTGDIQVM